MNLKEAKKNLADASWHLNDALAKITVARFNFAKASREERKSRNQSLRDVARDLGFSVAFLSDVELGRRLPNHDIISYYE